jgi:leucyl-tRNA synthetase
MLPIMENDNCKKIAERLARVERNVKDGSKVKLFRYEDPVLGPRTIPSLDQIDNGKVEMLEEFVFKLCLESKTVTLHNTTTSDIIPINAIVYRV